MKKTNTGLLVPSTYRQHIYTTARGKQLKLIPISPYTLQDYQLSFTEQYEAENPRPEKPTYEIEVLGGSKVLYEHDAKTVKTDEEKAALQAYEEYEPALNNFVQWKLLDVFIVEGVDVDPNDDTAWLKKKKFFKVELPDDEIELKLMYVREQLVIDDETGADFARLPEAIARLSGISEKAVAAGKATFRRNARRKQNTTGQSETDPDGEMVDIEPVPGNEDGEGVGEDAG